MTHKLPDELQKRSQAALEGWRKEGKAAVGRRPSLRTTRPWLGWVEVVDKQLDTRTSPSPFPPNLLLLSMGGSSLGPRICRDFGSKPGYPKLHVLDSTDPAQNSALRSTASIGYPRVE